jgi:hypothetical protein
LRTNATRGDRTPLLNLDPLQVGAELPTRDARSFSAVATQVLRFSTLGDLIAKHSRFTANITLPRHPPTSLSYEFGNA